MLRAGQVLQLVVMGLLGLAVVMIQSANLAVNGGEGDWRGMMLGMMTSRVVVYAGLALLVMYLASKVDVRRILAIRGWYQPAYWMLFAALVLVGVAMVPGLGKTTNGAARWISLGGGLQFQPSELVKWVMVGVLACWCGRRAGGMKHFWGGLLPVMVLLGGSCALILVEDLGTAALIGLVGMCLLLAGGAKVWQLGMFGVGAVVGLVAAIYQSPYRWERIVSFIHPFADAEKSGYQAIQSMVAISGGGVTGRGLGNGVQKFGYLPEDTTDFIFAVICEEMGVMGAVLVVGMYLLLLWVGLGIVRRCGDGFGRLFGLGVLLTIGFQAVINMAVVTVVVPTKGIALPLLSSGGTGWILTAMAVGFLAGLDDGERKGLGLESQVEDRGGDMSGVKARVAY